ncbi:hypothetical protein QYF36_002743 [Acer negundo]|nr:hypothetical protein QYF36_002743 [Acer negundo]
MTEGVRKTENAPLRGGFKNLFGQSFAEVVVDSQNKTGFQKHMPNQRVKEFCWDGRNVDASWLGLCVVGVLKSFIDISSLVKGIISSVTRISGRISFSSVGVWSPAITPQARLAWIEIRGIPLDCWCLNWEDKEEELSFGPGISNDSRKSGDIVERGAREAATINMYP